jgi:hypothetical protein
MLSKRSADLVAFALDVNDRIVVRLAHRPRHMHCPPALDIPDDSLQPKDPVVDGNARTRWDICTPPSQSNDVRQSDRNLWHAGGRNPLLQSIDVLQSGRVLWHMGSHFQKNQREPARTNTKQYSPYAHLSKKGYGENPKLICKYTKIFFQFFIDKLWYFFQFCLFIG